MPTNSVYVLRENFPRELRYRSAVCRLELAHRFPVCSANYERC